VKPGEHPDFFRFAPPPGTSRESTIALRADGTFLHDGEVVEHRALHKALASWIAIHPDDGRFILTNGYDWTYFTVEDAPMHVLSLDATVDPPRLELFDGSSEPLDPSTLTVGADDVVHCRVRSGTLEARFSRFAQTGLAPLLVTDPGDESSPIPAVRVGGRDYPLPPRTKR